MHSKGSEGGGGLAIIRESNLDLQKDESRTRVSLRKWGLLYFFQDEVLIIHALYACTDESLV